MYVLKFQDRKIRSLIIERKLIKNSYVCKAVSNSFKLCLEEMLHIINFQDWNHLLKKELIFKSRHKNKDLIWLLAPNLNREGKDKEEQFKKEKGKKKLWIFWVVGYINDISGFSFQWCKGPEVSIERERY